MTIRRYHPYQGHCLPSLQTLEMRGRRQERHTSHEATSWWKSTSTRLRWRNRLPALSGRTPTCRSCTPWGGSTKTPLGSVFKNKRREVGQMGPLFRVAPGPKGAPAAPAQPAPRGHAACARSEGHERKRRAEASPLSEPAPLHVTMSPSGRASAPPVQTWPPKWQGCLGRRHLCKLSSPPAPRSAHPRHPDAELWPPELCWVTINTDFS